MARHVYTAELAKRVHAVTTRAGVVARVAAAGENLKVLQRTVAMEIRQGAFQISRKINFPI